MSENMMLSTKLSKAFIAVNRFGYGAKGDELTLAGANPKSWIKSQLTSISFNSSLPHSKDVLIEYALFQQHKKRFKKLSAEQQKLISNEQANMQKTSKYFSETLKMMAFDSLERAVQSSHSVSWRLLDFFSNHFSVSANGRLMVGLAGTLEREAIAPNLLGSFEDMLLAVEQHPAMLIYLNNEKSYGPNSKIAKKRKKGLNENLAREILELHTLGVSGGYIQDDVVELAKGISGWSVHNYTKSQRSGFTFNADGHEPGTRVLLGKKYSSKGIDQGQQMLGDLASHSSTIKHLCYKLAYHFVSESPPKELLLKMESTWKNSKGNIKQVMYSMFDADESWISSPQKYKSPRDFVISAYRAVSPKKINANVVLKSLISLGQQPFNAGSPAGFSDDSSDWLGANALMGRVDWSTMVSTYIKKLNIDKVMADVLGDNVSRHTYQLVMRAESRQQAMVLLLMSPEFQRR